MLFDRIADSHLLIRRLTLSLCHLIREEELPEQKTVIEQMDLFTDYEALSRKQEKEDAEREREQKMQKAVLEIKKKFGKNAVLRGMSLEKGATARDRNCQIGGHRA